MLSPVLLTLGLVTFAIHCVLASDSDPNIDISRGLGEAGLDVDGLHNSLEDLGNHLRKLQKRTCKLGVLSHGCQAQEMNDAMSWLMHLQSPNSPGKRSEAAEADGDQRSPAKAELEKHVMSILADIAKHREAVETLNALVQSLREHPKRSHVCRVNLGGHCLTEELDKAADWYHYLRSGASPGRRRRSVQSSNQDEAR